MTYGTGIRISYAKRILLCDQIALGNGFILVPTESNVRFLTDKHKTEEKLENPPRYAVRVLDVQLSANAIVVITSAAIALALFATQT